MFKQLRTPISILSRSVHNSNVSPQSLTSEFGKTHLFPGLSRTSEMVISHGKGCYVYSTDSKEYLDCSAGIGVTNTGKTKLNFPSFYST